MRVPFGPTLATLAIALLVSSVVSTAPAAAQDADGDGVSDTADNCLDRANPLQQDTNADGFGNACDADWTNDGVVSFRDYALFKSHFGHNQQDASDFEISIDGSGIVGLPTFGLFHQQFGGPPGPSGLGTDADADGWVEPGIDNCPGVYNSDQADSNGDGIGDRCDDDFEPVGSGNGLVGKILVDSSGNVHMLYADGAEIRWLREQGGAWVTDTVYTTANSVAVSAFATDLKNGSQVCAFWGEGYYRNLYGCIDENGVLQAQLLPPAPFDGTDGASALAHDTAGRPHVVAYVHGLYNDGTTNLNHYLRHTRFDGSGWTSVVNLPVQPGAGDPETGNFDLDIVVDPVTGAVHVVHFVYDASTTPGELLGCNDRGDLAVSTWDPATGAFGPLHIAVQGVDPGLRGKSMWDLDAWLDDNGQIHAVYRVGAAASGPGPCEENPNYDPTERVFYATGPLLGAWQVTLLEERPHPTTYGTLGISNLVRDASGTLHVASHENGDDPQNIHLFSISGGEVTEQAIDIDTDGSSWITRLRLASRAAAQAPMILLNQLSTWLVREPSAP